MTSAGKGEGCQKWREMIEEGGSDGETDQMKVIWHRVRSERFRQTDEEEEKQQVLIKGEVDSWLEGVHVSIFE